MSTRFAAAHRRGAFALSILTIAACSSRQSASYDSSATRAGATASAAGSASSDTALVPVRGTVAALSDTVLSVSTSEGTQQIHVTAPLRVYERKTSDLAHVTPNSFVGITSVAQPDGSQRATEIHIFPEELRGTGEGSRPMDASATGGRSTMTNGAVAPSASRMTNGAVGSTNGANTYTVRYQGGQQTIQIPPNVSVTAIVPSQAAPAVGANVVVLAHKSGANQLNTSAVMLLGPTGK